MKGTSKYSHLACIAGVFLISTTIGQTVFAGDDSHNLAKQLANPVASLISVPFQLNYDSNIGADDDGDRFTLNLEPVIPFSLNEDWNLISRTILPFIAQDEVYSGAGSQSGLGDTVQSFFFTPAQVAKGDMIWGAGPVLLLPTATDDLLGTDKWGLGPTGVVLKQDGPWTYGALVNHIWSVAGDDEREDVNATFLQPFISHTSKAGTTMALNTEATYDWEAEQWTVPFDLTVTQVMKLGNQMVSLGGGIRYWAESADSGPEGFGFRLIFTLLLPE